MYPLNQKKPLHIFLYKNAEYKKKARNYTLSKPRYLCNEC